ncbi:MAG: radical SAM family heme chaperone HemW [Saprospiraceae bacterium]|nr:radical SAM family heme chaperone HemW [Saprospiraceae bacterium]
MAGLYIHIPFCKKACHYCNFHFSTSLKNKKVMIECIALELEQRSGELSEKVDTIYFGGGTPSLLNPNDFYYLFTKIENHYDLNKELEISIEANPDDLNEKNLSSLKDCGFNRLSIGIQSFSNEILFQMNRAHSSQQALSAVYNAQKVGFSNISIDLMFGLPDLNESMWKETLHKAIDLNVQHISCYNLTVEESTALWHFVNTDKIHLPPILNQESQFFAAHDILCDNGFDHYEISNYSKPNFKSQHNSSYWNRTAYIGIGPSAHSFLGRVRSWNISNNVKYMDSVNSLSPTSSQETLSVKDQFNEMVMLALRTSKGIKKADLNNYSLSIQKEFNEKIASLKSNGIIKENNSHLRLTDKSYYLCDLYSSELFAE